MSGFHAVAAMALMLTVSAQVAAEGAPRENSTTSTWQDPQLKWGPCPPFIPKGCEIAVLHGDPGRANADVFFKVPAGFTIPEHWHTSAERMVLAAGELAVTYAGQPAVTLKPGMYAYGPPKVAHKATCAKDGPCVLFIAFEAPVDAFPADGKPK